MSVYKIAKGLGVSIETLVELDSPSDINPQTGKPKDLQYYECSIPEELSHILRNLKTSIYTGNKLKQGYWKEMLSEEITHMLRTGEIGTDSYLLPNATTISLEEGFSLCEQFGGVAYPAHIDREANGIIAILGLVPDVPKFSCVELHDADKKEEYAEQYHLHDKRFVFSSDAHYLWDISEKQNYVDLDIDDNNYSSALVREKFLALLKGGAGSA